MSGGVYGGDEVGALVFDPGHFSFRAGFAGEEVPKAEIPSAVGINAEDEPPNKDENKPPSYQCEANKSSKKYFIDTGNIKHPRKNVEIGTFLKDSMIEDFDMFDSVVDYVFKYFNADPSVHPVLISEDPLNTKVKRERLTELMFEKYNIPAFYVCKNAVLASFANNRPSGLILDSGATHTSAVPVYDGYCLTKAVVRIPLGGDAMTTQCKHMLEESGVELIPPYMIAGKEVVLEKTPARWTKKPTLPEVTKSFHNYMCKEVIQDFQASVLQVSDTTYDAEAIEKLPMQHYEFPNGYHQDFGTERFRIAESLFDPSFLRNLNTPPPQFGISSGIVTSINMCDADLRASLYGGIIVTGGNSLLPGFIDRLNHDLATKYPANAKLRIHSAISTAERRFGAWIGGSILASLGSFQQLWISKQEYEETGKSIVEKKCP